MELDELVRLEMLLLGQCFPFGTLISLLCVQLSTWTANLDREMSLGFLQAAAGCCLRHCSSSFNLSTLTERCCSVSPDSSWNTALLWVRRKVGSVYTEIVTLVPEMSLSFPQAAAGCYAWNTVSFRYASWLTLCAIPAEVVTLVQKCHPGGSWLLCLEYCFF